MKVLMIISKYVVIKIMSRKKPRVRYELDSGDIRNLIGEEIKVILRAADELAKLLEGKDYSFVQELKYRNRGMILLLIEKIKLTRYARFIPLLIVWMEIECKKVQAEIQRAIDYLMKEGTIF